MTYIYIYTQLYIYIYTHTLCACSPDLLRLKELRAVPQLDQQRAGDLQKAGGGGGEGEARQ